MVTLQLFVLNFVYKSMRKLKKNTSCIGVFDIILHCRSYQKCGCVNPSLWNARSIMIPGTKDVIFAPLCNQTDVCYQQVTNTIVTEASDLDKRCPDCREQCLTIDFILQKSSLAIGFEWEGSDIKHFVEKSNISLPTNWSTMWSTYVESSYLRLSVVPETNSVESSIQTAALNLVGVVSNIGGQTGLWVGISFLSIMELVEIVYRLLRHECHVICSKIQKMPG